MPLNPERGVLLSLSLLSVSIHSPTVFPLLSAAGRGAKHSAHSFFFFLPSLQDEGTREQSQSLGRRIKSQVVLPLVGWRGHYVLIPSIYSFIHSSIQSTAPCPSNNSSFHHSIHPSLNPYKHPCIISSIHPSFICLTILHSAIY